jgi:hypothetical protein
MIGMFELEIIIMLIMSVLNILLLLVPKDICLKFNLFHFSRFAITEVFFGNRFKILRHLMIFS